MSSIQVSVYQKDPRTLVKFVSIIGIGHVGGPNVKGIYYWYVSRRNARKSLDILWPYLSEPKKEQALRKGYEPMSPE